MRRTAATPDPEFNNLFVKKIKSSGAYPISVISDTDIVPPSVLSLTKLKVYLENDKTSGFIIDIDENNPTTLILRKFINNTIIDTGILYDTKFNTLPKSVAENTFLYISPVFTLPTEETIAQTFLQANLTFILLLNSTSNTEFSLFALATNGSDDYKQIRISNVGDFSISIKFNNNALIEMVQERISLVWCKSGDTYTWVYVP